MHLLKDEDITVLSAIMVYISKKLQCLFVKFEREHQIAHSSNLLRRTVPPRS